jgi:acid phosphatase (class B)
MLKRIAFMIVIFSMVLSSCTIVKNDDNIRWITLKDIEKSLGDEPPMNVAFDIDDTVLFSSPGYFYGQQKYSPGSSTYLGKEDFWKEMNNGLDRFSIPKECAQNLIELHKKRGDSIYFITARTGTETETVTEILAELFGLVNPNKVIFTGINVLENPKIQPIKDNRIQIFYGDSDGDVRAAQIAGARAIRIMRAGNSTNKPIPKAGCLGEEVLVDSDH